MQGDFTLSLYISACHGFYLLMTGSFTAHELLLQIIQPLDDTHKKTGEAVTARGTD